jgi:hypothetical protein
MAMNRLPRLLLGLSVAACAHFAPGVGTFRHRALTLTLDRHRFTVSDSTGNFTLHGDIERGAQSLILHPTALEYRTDAPISSKDWEELPRDAALRVEGDSALVDSAGRRWFRIRTSGRRRVSAATPAHQRL